MKKAKTTTEQWERAQAHHQAGRAKEAETLYREVIARKPQHEQALFMLGVLLFETGRIDETRRFLERLVAIRPNEPVYLVNLGEVYRRQGELELAAGAFARALDENPNLPEASQNLGITLMNGGAVADALPHLEHAVALRPDNPAFHVSVAWALLRLHRAEASITHCRRAIALDPDHAPAHHHLAAALNEHGDRDGAIASYRRAVALDPSDLHAHSNLILATLTNPGYDAAALYTEARAWAKLHAEPLRKHWRPHPNDKNPERRLRVGYVSPDLRAHPVHNFLKPLLEHHDPAAVEIFLYSAVERPDAVTAHYRALAGERFREILRLDDERAAELVRRDRIDVLVDLALHSNGGRLRLFALKPAPIQMTWLGYSTSGLDAIDYRITDPFGDPPDIDPGVYSEACLRLPETAWCYAALESDLPVGPLPARAAGGITFGCLNSYRKVHAGALALWARVLREVPGSRLLLYVEEDEREAVRRALDAAGVQADRVDFGGRVSRREYLARYNRIDIALDTFPFAGITTSLDGFWMGVPTVTLTGNTPLHRVGVSFAMNLGLPELVATSQDDFVAKAVALAGDLDRLGRLRAELRPRLEASPLGDASRFARNLEAAYRAAWRRACLS